MADINAFEVLKYGVIGLGFLLAFLAYRLLSAEQARDKSRPNILKSIYVFMGFSLLLCVIGFASEFAKSSGAGLQGAEEQHQELQQKMSNLKEQNSQIAQDLAVKDNQLKTANEQAAKAEQLDQENRRYREKLVSIQTSLKLLLDAKEGVLAAVPEDDPRFGEIKDAMLNIDARLRELAEPDPA